MSLPLRKPDVVPITAQIMESNKDKNQQKPSRMTYDVEDTSRTMKPGSIKGSTAPSSNSSLNTSGSSRQGRGWHGDSEGHKKAGSQSHKNSGQKKS
ncbi:hypothetical protein [Pontibacter chitinilyticus]|uniref:hypothetical protein n=1 Tax=Pontibacter chitinilyticus TaxID=2674989 RepID=UPI00321C1072